MQFRLFALTAALLCFTPKLCSAHSPLHTMIKVKYAAERIIKELSRSPAAAAAAVVDDEAAPAHVPQRSKRAAPYSPLTTPSYDLGSKTACSKPVVPGCSYGSSVTIPSYLSRFVTGTFGESIGEVLNLLKGLPSVSDDCGDRLQEMFCGLIAQPICMDSKAVYNFDFAEKCDAVIKECTTNPVEAVYIRPILCDEDISDVYKLNGQSYPLTDCSVPQVDFCSNTAMSPDWLVAKFELNRGSFQTIESLANSLNETCKEWYFQLFCTVPTCDGDSLRGYRDSNTCSRLVQCFNDPQLRVAAEKVLQCSEPGGSGQERAKSGLLGVLFAVGLGLLLTLVEVL